MQQQQGQDGDEANSSAAGNKRRKMAAATVAAVAEQRYLGPPIPEGLGLALDGTSAVKDKERISCRKARPPAGSSKEGKAAFYSGLQDKLLKLGGLTMQQFDPVSHDDYIRNVMESTLGTTAVFPGRT